MQAQSAFADTKARVIVTRNKGDYPPGSLSVPVAGGVPCWVQSVRIRGLVRAHHLGNFRGVLVSECPWSGFGGGFGSENFALVSQEDRSVYWAIQKPRSGEAVVA